MDPVLTEHGNLRIEHLLEQGPALSEGGNSGTSGTTPDHQVGQETSNGVSVDVLEKRQNLEHGGLDILDG